jgi:S-ribosylhomocysteine lyase
MLEFIKDFKGDIPGAKPAECGNYLEQNLNIAKLEARKYAKLLKAAKPENFHYPAAH